MKRLLLLLLVLLNTFPFFGQNIPCDFMLKGIVIDEHDQQPLSFSTIYILELEKGYVSDINGIFVVPALCRQNYTLVIGHIGCEPDTQQVFVSSSLLLAFRSFSLLYISFHYDSLSVCLALKVVAVLHASWNISSPN